MLVSHNATTAANGLLAEQEYFTQCEENIFKKDQLVYKKNLLLTLSATDMMINRSPVVCSANF